MHQSIAAAPSSGMAPGLENAQSPGSTKFGVGVVWGAAGID